ncbi:hypothetical protein [Halomarina oriensis]|uniref:hypothetical protein n=1 Tax=Halomarina oriensis TaxID=671145 RepID=UPI0013039011|nr:hypothetical protein [Halomarina oriensis]
MSPITPTARDDVTSQRVTAASEEVAGVETARNRDGGGDALDGALDDEGEVGDQQRPEDGEDAPREDTERPAEATVDGHQQRATGEQADDEPRQQVGRR